MSQTSPMSIAEEMVSHSSDAEFDLFTCFSDVACELFRAMALRGVEVTD